MNNVEEHEDVETVSIPFNENNVLIKNEDVERLFKKFNINFKVNNINLYRKALTHKSYIKREYYGLYKDILDEAFRLFPKDTLPLQDASNERFEFLGDSVIDLIVAEYLFDRYPKEKEGFMTKLRTKLVRTSTLAKLSSYLRLTDYIIMSKYVEDLCDGRQNPKLLENCFESLVGVLYKQLGFEFCNDFVLALIENVDLIDISDMIENDDNFKDQLMRYCHRTYEGRNPVYKELKVEGLSNHAIFTMCVMVPISENKMIMLGMAKGPSKKDAEQESAKMAMSKLMKEDLKELVFIN